MDSVKKLLVVTALVVAIIGSWFVMPVETQVGVIGTQKLPSGCTNGQVASYNTSTLRWACAADASGSPGGSDTQVQYNDGGSFGGQGGFRYNESASASAVYAIQTAASGPSFALGADDTNGVGPTITMGGNNNNTSYPVIRSYESQGTMAAPEVSGANEAVFGLVGYGHDGTNFQQAAVIQLRVDGTPTSGNVPGRIDFLVSSASLANNTPYSIAPNGVRIGPPAASGVLLTGDGDGALTFLGLGNGFDEDFTINLDDTENVAVVTTSTGLLKFDFGTLILEGKHNSSDGTVGVTVTTCTGFKDGLCISGT